MTGSKHASYISPHHGIHAIGKGAKAVDTHTQSKSLDPLMNQPFRTDCVHVDISWCGRGHRVRNRGRILVQVTIYRRLLIGRDGHLDQSEAYDIS